MFKFTGDTDEISYPFIYERSPLCDFEVLTDELCTLFGLAGSACPTDQTEVQKSLFHWQPKIFDLNGSVRGVCTLTEEDITELKRELETWRQRLTPTGHAFVLPRGTGAVVLLHQARSLSKKATRALVWADEAGVSIPDTLPRFCNVLTNYLFTLAQWLNEQAGVVQPAYHSRNYRVKSPKNVNSVTSDPAASA